MLAPSFTVLSLIVCACGVSPAAQLAEVEAVGRSPALAAAVEPAPVVGQVAAAVSGDPTAAAQVAADEPAPGWRPVLLLEDSRLDRVRSLTWVPATDTAPGRLFVGGRMAGLWLDTDAAVVAAVSFDPRMSTPLPVDVDGDGRFEYADTGGGWQAVGLRDASGASLWSLGGGFFDATPNGMAVADLDGDGLLEFIVGFNGDDGLRVLDEQGHQLYAVDGVNVFSVATFDVDGDGVAEIVHSDVTGLVARKPDGTPTTATLPEFSSFSVAADRDGRAVLASVHDGETQLVAADGSLVGRFPMPGRGHADVELAWTRDGQGAAVVAIGRTLGASDGRSELLFFSADGALLQRQAIAAARVCVLSAPLGEDGAQVLLVGAGNQLWRYDLPD